ncbi:hypothetical protein [Ruegeria sp. MALMAid1280]|uniref:hypothetical protein n=1 Tax=Ruegeria sp. MALMAid1280 TaxID=3411634 RepID=UPI003B9FA3F8
MNVLRIIHLDEPLPLETVVFAIAPLDSFTRAIVRGPVTAQIEAHGAVAKRNLSGLLVFVERAVPGGDPMLPVEPRYSVKITARQAGYFDQRIEVDRPSPDVMDSQRLIEVPMHRIPSAPFTIETSLVRGVVLIDRAPVNGADVGAVVSNDAPDPDDVLPFRTRTDTQGDFALPLRLPDQTPGQTGTASAHFWFRITAPDAPAVMLKRQVRDGQQYSFGLPIDLADGAPPLVPLLVPSRP